MSSVPVRVLPQPRPAIINQTRQLPGGVIWWGLANLIQRDRVTKACKFESGKFGKQSPRFGKGGFAFSGFIVFFRRKPFEQNLGRLNPRRVACAVLH